MSECQEKHKQQKIKMTKYIDKLTKVLKVEFYAAWFLVALTACFGELGVIANGAVQPNSASEFKMNTVVIVLTVVGVPLALKLFSLNTTKGLRRMNNDEALGTYHVWSLVRMGILCLDAVLGFVAYYLTLNVTGALCALVALAVTMVCWPSDKKISVYLDELDNN